jgi:hypothetical protein
MSVRRIRRTSAGLYRLAVIIIHFDEPALLHLGSRYVWVDPAGNPCKILTPGDEGVGVVVKLACRCQMVSPSLGGGSERVIPHERRNSNLSAHAVVPSQYHAGEIPASSVYIIIA